MKIVKYKDNFAKDVSKVIRESYKQFCAKDATSKAVSEYIEENNYEKYPDKVKKKYAKSKIFFVALVKNKIIGFIKGTKNHVGNLFVLGKYHKLGIGRVLLEKFEREAIKQKSKLIKLSSSLFAVNFYQRQGYKKTTGIRNKKGNKIQPMKKLFL